MTDRRPLPDSEEGDERRESAALLRWAMIGLAVFAVIIVGLLVVSRIG